eukprot:COSAG01_NODE_5913_length_3957_cov_228.332037_1_plen_130_part_00
MRRNSRGGERGGEGGELLACRQHAKHAGRVHWQGADRRPNATGIFCCLGATAVIRLAGAYVLIRWHAHVVSTPSTPCLVLLPVINAFSTRGQAFVSSGEGGEVGAMRWAGRFVTLYYGVVSQTVWTTTV